MANTLEIPSVLAALGNIAGEEQIRYAINNIHLVVADGRLTVEVTDGAVLCRLSGYACDCEDCDLLIPAKAWEAALGPGDAKKTALLSREQERTVITRDCGDCQRAFTIGKVKGRFPKVEDVIPKYESEPTVQISFKPALLWRFVQTVVNALPPGAQESALTLVVPRASKKPMVIRARDPDLDINIEAAIMPLRETEGD